jgi:UDP-N-acetylmuramoyl-tripeptide--D-alanyl-D-alanine ligase
VDALPTNGVAFLNCDDAYVSQFGRDFPGRAVYFGSGPCADPRLLKVTEDLAGLHIAHSRRRAREPAHAADAGRAQRDERAGRTGRCLEAGVDLEAALAALESLTTGDKRGQVIEVRGATILNDSYNSNPEALRSMIRTLALHPARRRILVAGEMLEMGEHGPALHAACGRAAAEAGLDLVVGVGGNAEHLAAAACAGGVAALFLPDAEAAGRWLAKNLQSGDVALVKGSRGVHLERAIEAV